jgi:5-methylcytosine-specific restriction endonuclease McrA
MDKEILQSLVNEGVSSYKIGDKLNSSPTNVRYWIKKHNITKETLIKEEKFCPRCTKNLPRSEFYNRRNGKGNSTYCKPCSNNHTLERQRAFKVKCVEYKGGKCESCGYDKCISALEFHHVNPKEKDFTIAHAKLLKFDENTKAELNKCVLLCANCHREEHFRISQEKNHLV